MNTNISAEQLRRAAAIKDEIEGLQEELNGLLGSDGASISSRKAKRGMSAAGRAAIAAAQRARWAKLKGGTSTKPARRGKRKMSPAARAKIAAAARARWKRAKAAGKNSL